MRKFVINTTRFILIGSIPLVIIILGYLALDPFKVLKSYDTYYDTNANGYIGINRDYVSTTTFTDNFVKKNYNSFILGNSRSIFYQVSDWKKHLTPQSSCFHFDAFGETLFGIYKKLEYASDKGAEIKNALVILDNSILIRDKPRSGMLFIISPVLVNNKNILNFHLTHLKAFLSPQFIFAYLDFRISEEVKPYAKAASLVVDIPRNYDRDANELRYEYFEDLINRGDYYTPERVSEFFKRDTVIKYSQPAIEENQKTLLRNIRDIFEEHNTNYKIIISPLYDQIKLNKNDLEYLFNLFGEQNVFDYSGPNKYTNDYRNYYETSHYRPHVSREILNEIYENK